MRPVRVSERAAVLRGLPHAVILRSLRRHVPQAPPPLRTCPQGEHQGAVVHCKKDLSVSSRDVTNQTLPGRDRIIVTLFYSGIGSSLYTQMFTIYSEVFLLLLICKGLVRMPYK